MIERRMLGTRLFLCAALLLLVAAVFHPVRHHEFVDFDDPTYVVDNPRLAEPFAWEGLVRDFNEPYESYWIPLTWISYRVDRALFGHSAGIHLLVNVALHAASTLLLFLGLLRATGAPWRCGFVAALFAVHPLHVESVAWVTERKDVLSGFFWMCAMYLHLGAGSAGDRPRLRELGTALAMALGLLAKPMIVTLPFALMLLDYWPLGRLRGEAGGWLARIDVDADRLRSSAFEKIPLFALAAVGSMTVVGTQREMGGMDFASNIPDGLRYSNALTSYAVYLWQSFVPVDLSVMYPHPLEPLPAWKPVSAAALVLGASLACLVFARRSPAPLVGWFWYLGNLVPVIGIVGVGMQAHADRWMYIPLIGLGIALAWGTEPMTRGRPRVGLAAGVMSAVAVLALAVLAHRQVGVWQNTFTLFEHAVRADERNWYAHHRLAVNHRWAGRYAESAEHYLLALRDLPQFARMQGELGDVLVALGDRAGADALYANANATGWDDPRAHARLGLVLASIGRDATAVDLLSHALDRTPEDAHLRSERALALARLGYEQEELPDLAK